MTRIKTLEKPYTEGLQATFDKIMGEGVPPLLLFTTIATSERAWRKFTAGSLLDGNLLTLRQRELIINRVCALTGCEYEWGVHVMAFAERAGLTRDDIGHTLDYPLRAEHWTEEEAVLLATIDALHNRATLTEAEFQATRRYFDDDQILELLMLAGFYRTVSYIANSLTLALEPNAARFRDFRHEAAQSS